MMGRRDLWNGCQTLTCDTGSCFSADSSACFSFWLTKVGCEVGVIHELKVLVGVIETRSWKANLSL